jgi:DNA-directed RNA polymerase subunit D
MVTIEKISSSENKMTFLLKKSTPAYSNALRRIMLTQVPVMAIENIEFSKNNSALYDEVLAHRLGLISLTTDLKSYELPVSDEDIENKKAKCTLQLTLKEKGPKTVYASDLKTADPKVKPVFGKTPLVKLLKDQEVELTATAILGKGKTHAKWSACHVWYNYNPKITINMKSDFEKVKDLYPPQVFNKKGQIDEKLILENNLVDAVAHIKEEVVKVEYNDTEFIFTVESWGQLPPKEIISESLNILDSKLDELAKLVK